MLGYYQGFSWKYIIKIGFYWVESKFCSIFIKLTLVLWNWMFEVVYQKKSGKCWWNWSPSEKPIHPNYTTTVFRITKTPILHRLKYHDLGTILGGGESEFYWTVMKPFSVEKYSHVPHRAL